MYSINVCFFFKYTGPSLQCGVIYHCCDVPATDSAGVLWHQFFLRMTHIPFPP